MPARMGMATTTIEPRRKAWQAPQMTQIFAPAVALVMLLATALSPAAAAEWGHYVNERFGVEIDVPPGFEPGEPPANGDGLRFSTPTAELSVFGSFITEDGFSRDASQRMGWAEEAGWALTSRVATPRWSSWSGQQGSRLLHARAISLCDGAAIGVFELVYYEADIAAFVPIITRLEASLADSGTGWQC